MTASPVEKAVYALREGDVIAYPTEAVWGLGCDPNNQAAVMKLLEIKQRSVAKGLILVMLSWGIYWQSLHCRDRWKTPSEDLYASLRTIEMEAIDYRFLRSPHG